MTLAPDREANLVYSPTAVELASAIDSAIERSGFSRTELRDQALSGRFESFRARMAWDAVGPMIARDSND